jgi:hypothetical protein
VTGIDIIRKQLCLVIFYPLSKEANMLSLKSLFAFAVLVPLLGAAIHSRGGEGDKNQLHCGTCRQANEAVAAQGVGANIGDKNAMGQDAYRRCCFKVGVRP